MRETESAFDVQCRLEMLFGALEGSGTLHGTADWPHHQVHPLYKYTKYTTRQHQLILRHRATTVGYFTLTT